MDSTLAMLQNLHIAERRAARDLAEAERQFATMMGLAIIINDESLSMAFHHLQRRDDEMVEGAKLLEQQLAPWQRNYSGLAKAAEHFFNTREVYRVELQEWCEEVGLEYVED